MKINTLLTALAGAVVLTACGGGGGDGPGVTEQVPASASASSEGFMDYLKALVASSADSLEPVDASALVAPRDDTSEPSAVN